MGLSTALYRRSLLSIGSDDVVVKSQLERMREKVVVTYLRYHPAISLQRLRRYTKKPHVIKRNHFVSLFAARPGLRHVFYSLTCLETSIHGLQTKIFY
jgi:shikimate kinase